MAKMLNKDEMVSLLNIVPRNTKITLTRKFFGLWKYEKTYTIRPFSFRDKIEVLAEYGEERFNKIATEPDNIEFETLHFKIIYMLIENKTSFFGMIQDFKDFNGFLKHIIGFKKEVEILAAAMVARGLSTSALLTQAELKDILADVKKKRTSTGATPSTN